MSLEDVLSRNQADWGLEMLRTNKRVDTSLVGVRGDAAIFSAILPKSNLALGLVDESARAAAGFMRERGVDYLIAAFDTDLKEFTLRSSRALVVASTRQTIILPVWEGSDFYLGERRSDQGWSTLKQLEEFRLSPRVKWSEENFRLGNKILDLEERFA